MRKMDKKSDCDRTKNRLTKYEDGNWLKIDKIEDETNVKTYNQTSFRKISNQIQNNLKPISV